MGGIGSTTGGVGRLGALALAAAAIVVALVPIGAASAGVSSPEVTVTPPTDLADNQEVTVSGTGFPGSVQVTVLQCETGATTFEQCDNSWIYWADVDAGGAFSTAITLRQTIGVQGGPLDCSVAGACVIGAGVMPNWSPFATLPLQVADFSPSTLPPVAEPDCPAPYGPYGYFRGAVDVPEFVPGLNGTLVPYAETGATVDIRQDGDVLLLTAVIDGVTRAAHHRGPHLRWRLQPHAGAERHAVRGGRHPLRRRRGGLRHARSEQQRRLHPLRLALRRPVPAGGDRRGGGDADLHGLSPAPASAQSSAGVGTGSRSRATAASTWRGSRVR